jgi:hypothetical protein
MQDIQQAIYIYEWEEAERCSHAHSTEQQLKLIGGGAGAVWREMASQEVYWVLVLGVSS